MKEILVWLLVSVPTDNGSYNPSKHPLVFERFATVAECQRVAAVLRESKPSGWLFHLQCVQARIVIGA